MSDASRCTAEPISWLQLEELALGALDPASRGAVEAHLAGCAACRAARDHIEADSARPLAPLPDLVLARARRRAPRRVLVAAATLAAAAALLLLVRGRAPGPSPDRAGAKGGELAVGLVRDRGGELAFDPIGFRPGDRFKVLVTCASAGEVDVDVAVHQAGSLDHPIERARIRCGNQVPLPGAFRLTGDQPAAVCAVVEGERACIDLAPERD